MFIINVTRLTHIFSIFERQYRPDPLVGLGLTKNQEVESSKSSFLCIFSTSDGLN